MIWRVVVLAHSWWTCKRWILWSCLAPLSPSCSTPDPRLKSMVREGTEREREREEESFLLWQEVKTWLCFSPRKFACGAKWGFAFGVSCFLRWSKVTRLKTEKSETQRMLMRMMMMMMMMMMIINRLRADSTQQHRRDVMEKWSSTACLWFRSLIWSQEVAQLCSRLLTATEASSVGG